MDRYELLHERQPDAGAFDAATLVGFDSAEPFEDVRKLCRGDADAGIAHRAGHLLLVTGDADADRSGLGVLDRVGDQVPHDLLPQVRIDVGHRAALAVDLEHEPGIGRERRERVDTPGCQGTDIDRRGVEAESFGIDAGEVEQRVDELEQSLAASMRGLQLSAIER